MQHIARVPRSGSLNSKWTCSGMTTGRYGPSAESLTRPGAPPLSALFADRVGTRDRDIHHGKYRAVRLRSSRASRTLPLSAIRRPSFCHVQLLPPSPASRNPTGARHLRTNSGAGTEMVRRLHHRLRCHARARTSADDRTRAQCSIGCPPDAQTKCCAQSFPGSSLLATPLLRFQCVERREARRELKYLHRNPGSPTSGVFCARWGGSQ